MQPINTCRDAPPTNPPCLPRTHRLWLVVSVTKREWSLEKNMSEYGKEPQLLAFINDNYLQIRAAESAACFLVVSSAAFSWCRPVAAALRGGARSRAPFCCSDLT